jgi:hypothetical protein
VRHASSSLPACRRASQTKGRQHDHHLRLSARNRNLLVLRGAHNNDGDIVRYPTLTNEMSLLRVVSSGIASLFRVMSGVWLDVVFCWTCVIRRPPMRLVYPRPRVLAHDRDQRRGGFGVRDRYQSVSRARLISLSNREADSFTTTLGMRKGRARRDDFPGSLSEWEKG